MRLKYDFSAAADILKAEIEAADSSRRISLEDELLLCDNGMNMMKYCCRPKVVSLCRFSVSDFYLFYPLQDKSWRKLPNQLDSAKLNNKFVSALYAPDDSKEIYYSAEDEQGIRNIYRTNRGDSLWSVPKLINEHITSCSNEITPFVSPDGKSLYFASEGLYGMGGYDLYVSQWDENTGDWGIPSNMGFPFSSPYDDLLFVTSDDGHYSIFASNRDCSSDSVTVYVIEHDPMPLRVSVTDPQELMNLCSLNVKTSSSGSRNLSSVSNPMGDDENTRMYVEKMNLVHSLRDSLDEENEALDKLRTKLSDEGDDETKSLSKELLRRELNLPLLQKKVSDAAAELQKIELDFLMKGISIDLEETKQQVERETVSSSSSYIFTKKSLGKDLEIALEVPEVKFDYSFKVLEEAQFALDNNLPDGLVYQIRLFTLSKKATLNKFKGLSPIFEQSPQKGKYAYSVGLFFSYNDALSHLNTVKRLGFKDAMISAANSGKPVSISSARALEKKIKTLYKIKIYPSNGQSLPDAAISAIHSNTDKDIVRALEGAAVVFEVGPFDSKERCEEMKSILIQANVSNLTIFESGKIISE